jgi:hypothetical protein
LEDVSFEEESALPADGYGRFVFLKQLVRVCNLIFSRTRRKIAGFLLFNPEDFDEVLRRFTTGLELAERLRICTSSSIKRGDLLLGSGLRGFDTGYTVAFWKVTEGPEGFTFFVDLRLVDPYSYIKTKLVLEG